MNAISYFSSALAKHGKYGSRPKVEIPENTESAWNRVSWGIFGGQLRLQFSPEFRRLPGECYTTGSCAVLILVFDCDPHELPQQL